MNKKKLKNMNKKKLLTSALSFGMILGSINSGIYGMQNLNRKTVSVNKAQSFRPQDKVIKFINKEFTLKICDSDYKFKQIKKEVNDLNENMSTYKFFSQIPELLSKEFDKAQESFCDKLITHEDIKKLCNNNMNEDDESFCDKLKMREALIEKIWDNDLQPFVNQESQLNLGYSDEYFKKMEQEMEDLKGRMSTLQLPMSKAFKDAEKSFCNKLIAHEERKELLNNNMAAFVNKERKLSIVDSYDDFAKIEKEGTKLKESMLNLHFPLSEAFYKAEDSFRKKLKSRDDIKEEIWNNNINDLVNKESKLNIFDSDEDFKKIEEEVNGLKLIMSTFKFPLSDEFNDAEESFCNKLKARENTKELWKTKDGQPFYIVQGPVGNCYLISALWFIATQFNEKQKFRMIHSDENGNIIINVKKDLPPNADINTFIVRHGGPDYITYDPNSKRITINNGGLQQHFTGLAKSNLELTKILESLAGYYHAGSIFAEENENIKANDPLNTSIKVSAGGDPTIMNDMFPDFDCEMKKGLPELTSDMKPVFLGMNYYKKGSNGEEKLVGKHAYILEEMCHDSDGNTLLKVINPRNSTKREEFKVDSAFHEHYKPRWSRILNENA